MEPDPHAGPVEGAAAWEALAQGRDLAAVVFVPVAEKKYLISRESLALIKSVLNAEPKW